MKKKTPYNRDALTREILRHAQSLNLAPNWAETIAEKTAVAVDKWIASRGAVTETDVRRIAHQTLAKLHADIAFVYQNYDKII